MKNLPKIALGAWAWGNDGTFGGNITAEITGGRTGCAGRLFLRDRNNKRRGGKDRCAD